MWPVRIVTLLLHISIQARIVGVSLRYWLLITDVIINCNTVSLLLTSLSHIIYIQLHLISDIIYNKEDTNAFKGGPATLTCKVDGYSGDQMDGLAWKEKDGTGLIKEILPTVASQSWNSPLSTLIIHEVNQGGTYQCNVKVASKTYIKDMNVKLLCKFEINLLVVIFDMNPIIY